MPVDPRQSRRCCPHQTPLHLPRTSKPPPRIGALRRPDYTAAHQPIQFHLPGSQRPPRHQPAISTNDHGRTPQTGVELVSNFSFALRLSVFTQPLATTPFQSNCDSTSSAVVYPPEWNPTWLEKSPSLPAPTVALGGQ